VPLGTPNRAPVEQKAGGKSKVRVEQTADGTWQLVHPRCAVARREDLEEVEQMIEAGESEIARDELRWLLSECHDFLAGHKVLGDLALAENDVRLARGHYGYAYQIGAQALESGGKSQALPYRHEANREFFEAGRGLLECLTRQGKRGMAKKVLDQLLKCDPSDPLQLRQLVNSPRGGCGG
jgi:hypothetical protein